MACLSLKWWNYDATLLKHCCSVSGARVTLVQQMLNIAWMSFVLQEHKIHNNVALVMGHYYTQLYRSAAIVHEDCSQNYTTHTHACTFYIVQCILYSIKAYTHTHRYWHTFSLKHLCIQTFTWCTRVAYFYVYFISVSMTVEH